MCMTRTGGPCLRVKVSWCADEPSPRPRSASGTIPTDGVWVLDYRAGKLLGTVIDRVQGKIVGWAEVDLCKEFGIQPGQNVHFMMTTGMIAGGQAALYVAETSSGKFGVYTMGPRTDHKAGVVIHGTFILGLPVETRETIEQTIRYAMDLDVFSIQVSLAAPYPGTFLYDQAVENGWLDADNAELVDDHGIQIAPLHYPHLSHAEIFGSVETFYKRFYFRPGKIGSIVSEMVRSPEMMKRRLREGVEFFAFLKERRGAAA